MATAHFSKEVFYLKLTNRNQVSLFVLAPGGRRCFDLAHISEGESSSHFDFDLQPNLPRLPDRGFGMYAGDYEAEIFVAADNISAYSPFSRRAAPPVLAIGGDRLHQSFWRGTEGSNPPPSTGESGVNLNSEISGIAVVARRQRQL